MEDARAAWLDGAAITLALVALTLSIAYRFLNRTIYPIRQLAAFATELSRKPGATLRMRWGSQEVRELGRALNWSSAELARQVAETQRRLSRQRAILDTAADAIIGVTADGLIDSANDANRMMRPTSPWDMLLRTSCPSSASAGADPSIVIAMAAADPTASARHRFRCAVCVELMRSPSVVLRTCTKVRLAHFAPGVASVCAPCGECVETSGPAGSDPAPCRLPVPGAGACGEVRWRSRPSLSGPETHGDCACGGG